MSSTFGVTTSGRRPSSGWGPRIRSTVAATSCVVDEVEAEDLRVDPDGSPVDRRASARGRCRFAGRRGPEAALRHCLSTSAARRPRLRGPGQHTPLGVAKFRSCRRSVVVSHVHAGAMRSEARVRGADAVAAARVLGDQAASVATRSAAAGGGDASSAGRGGVASRPAGAADAASSVPVALAAAEATTVPQKQRSSRWRRPSPSRWRLTMRRVPSRHPALAGGAPGIEHGPIMRRSGCQITGQSSMIGPMSDRPISPLADRRHRRRDPRRRSRSPVCSGTGPPTGTVRWPAASPTPSASPSTPGSCPRACCCRRNGGWRRRWRSAGARSPPRSTSSAATVSWCRARGTAPGSSAPATAPCSAPGSACTTSTRATASTSRSPTRPTPPTSPS